METLFQITMVLYFEIARNSTVENGCTFIMSLRSMCSKHASSWDASKIDPSWCKKTLFQAKSWENNFVPNHKYRFFEAGRKCYQQYIRGVVQEHRDIFSRGNEFSQMWFTLIRKPCSETLFQIWETLFQILKLMKQYEERKLVGKE